MLKFVVFTLLSLFASQVVAQNMRNLRTAQPTKVADAYYVNSKSKFWIHTTQSETQVKEWINNAWVEVPVQSIEHTSRAITLVDGRVITFEKGQKIAVNNGGNVETFDFEINERKEKN